MIDLVVGLFLIVVRELQHDVFFGRIGGIDKAIGGQLEVLGMGCGRQAEYQEQLEDFFIGIEIFG